VTTHNPMTHPPARFAWVAGKDQLGHAQWTWAKGAERTGCGVDATGERWRWPVKVKCPGCLVAVGLGWMAYEP
jgi:hypothetical protein